VAEAGHVDLMVFVVDALGYDGYDAAAAAAFVEGVIDLVDVRLKAKCLGWTNCDRKEVHVSSDQSLHKQCVAVAVFPSDEYPSDLPSK